MSAEQKDADWSWLADFIRQKTAAEEVLLSGFKRLSGGAIQENLSFDAAIKGGTNPGVHHLVLRRDSATHVFASRPRDQEFHLLKAAWDAGVKVPEPLWLNEGGEGTKKAFYIMRRIEGTAGGHVLTKPGKLRAPEKLAEDLGRQLALIHAIKAAEIPSLSFLGQAPSDPIAAEMRDYRAYLDELKSAYPALEWGLRWCELHRPEDCGTEAVLVHRDFRTGNYLVDDDRLAAILDWEFAGWGDPMSDIGWFCAACWRFNAQDREAGGIAGREAFYRGFEAQSGESIDRSAIYFWEVMAHLRWAIIALQQGARFTEGGEASLDLALTGRVRVDELSYAVLKMTPPDLWRGDVGP